MGFLKFLFPVCFFWYFLLFGSVDIQHFTIRKQILKYSIQTLDEKINNSYPKKGELQFADGNKLPFYMIHHTAQYYSPQLWYDFLNKEIPEVVSFLGK